MAATELLQMMHQMTERHERLLQLADTKKDVIIHNRIDDLMRITAEENAIVKEIGKLEETARQCLQRAAQQLGVALGDAGTISDLLRALPEAHADFKSLLSDARDKLIETIDELKRKNELNQELVRQSLDYITFSIDLLTDAPEQDMTYQHPIGEQRTRKRTGLFDQKA
jgi:ABC-type transporter Mla subunit MlaD